MTEVLTERRWYDMDVGQTYDITERYTTPGSFQAMVCWKGKSIGRKFTTSKQTGRFLVTRVA